MVIRRVSLIIKDYQVANIARRLLVLLCGYSHALKGRPDLTGEKKTGFHNLNQTCVCSDHCMCLLYRYTRVLMCVQDEGQLSRLLLGSILLLFETGSLTDLELIKSVTNKGTPETLLSPPGIVSPVCRV